MSEPERIQISRDELFTKQVDQALEKEKETRRRVGGDPPPVSPLRALVNNSLFYLPLAGLLGALAVSALLESHIHDLNRATGDVVLVNNDPFLSQKGAISLTVGGTEVVLVPGKVKLEAGTHGEPAFGDVSDIKVGTPVDAIGLSVEGRGGQVIAAAIRPTSEDEIQKASHEDQESNWGLYLLFPAAAFFIAFGLLLAEGISTRNWVRMVERTALGSFLALLFSVLAFIPAGIFMTIAQKTTAPTGEDALVYTVHNMPAGALLMYATCRAMAWASVTTGLGLGMNMVRSTRAQLRNSVLGAALGGALGGFFFDPIDRFLHHSSMFAQAGTSRLVGLVAVGLSVGVFLALIERLAREAWLRVRTGPLAGKSFILYKTPTEIGSSPQSDIYLFKDAEIDPTHAVIHRVGQFYEIEDANSRTGTQVSGQAVRRRRLASGDQITLGGTVLEFEERAKRVVAKKD